MIFKQPLDVDVVVQLIGEVFNKTEQHLKKAQDLDKELGYFIVEKNELFNRLKWFLNNKLNYGKMEENHIYYNYDETINLLCDRNFNAYDIIYLALGVLLTQNSANVYVLKEIKSYSYDLIITLLKKFAESLKLYNDYISIIPCDEKYLKEKKINFKYKLLKEDDKIIYKTDILQVEYDYNLLLCEYNV